MISSSTCWISGANYFQRQRQVVPKRMLDVLIQVSRKRLAAYYMCYHLLSCAPELTRDNRSKLCSEVIQLSRDIIEQLNMHAWILNLFFWRIVCLCNHSWREVAMCALALNHGPLHFGHSSLEWCNWSHRKAEEKILDYAVVTPCSLLTLLEQGIDLSWHLRIFWANNSTL